MRHLLNLTLVLLLTSEMVTALTPAEIESNTNKAKDICQTFGIEVGTAGHVFVAIPVSKMSCPETEFWFRCETSKDGKNAEEGKRMWGCLPI